ncbi:ribokinase [Brevibacillus composti]|uniref:ribokinase n=1 Tax=Brevibacillus composti TaxID=2796470 RepID=UPI001E5B5D43|nr:ribokinase [Brevibacillus composti]
MRQSNIVVVGSLNMDIVVEAPRFPQVGETISGTKAHFIPGGKGGNQAVAAARLGARTVMVGMVGEDAFGNTLIQSLAANHVITKRVTKTTEVPTGLASIMIAHEDNHIVVVPGANAYCLPDRIDALEETIAAADVVLLQLEIPLETVVASAQLAKRLGKTVILNPAPAQKLPADLLRSVDYMTPNRSELYLLIAAQPTRGVDIGSIEFIHKEIVKKRDEGTAVLLVSAELSEVMSLSDRIGVLYNGELSSSWRIRKT